jgi:hypothetical protein
MILENVKASSSQTKKSLIADESDTEKETWYSVSFKRNHSDLPSQTVVYPISQNQSPLALMKKSPDMSDPSQTVIESIVD